MLAFLQYLIALMVVQSAEGRAGVPDRPDWTGIALLIVAFALAARIAGVLIARHVHVVGAQAMPALIHGWNTTRLAALVVFYVIAGMLGGCRIPEALGVDAWWLLPRIVQIVPFLLLVAATTWGLHPAAGAFRGGGPSALRAVLSEFRSALLPLAPVLAIIAVEDLQRLATPDTTAGRAFVAMKYLPTLQAVFILVVVFLVLLALPFLLRFIWRAKPLPAGPLRDRLVAYSKRTGFRAREILVWPTGGQILNAAVIGALPRFRYVLITDALIRTLDEEELEAVFAHEAGHARRGHILLFFGFTAVLALIGLIPGADALTDAILPRDQLVRGVLVMVVWMGVVLGWISRRFEQEADVYGVETVPLPGDATDPAHHPFSRALERIGREVGAIREMTGWRHFSIADRVDFVHRYLTEPAVRARYRRAILAIRGTLLTVVVGFVVAAGVRMPQEIEAAGVLMQSENVLLRELDTAMETNDPAIRAESLATAGTLAAVVGRNEEAARWLREAIALGRRDRATREDYAAVLERLKRPAGAARTRESHPSR